MNLRPKQHRRTLDPISAAGLQVLCDLARETHAGILPNDIPQLAEKARIHPHHLPIIIARLVNSGHILKTENSLAITPTVSAKLHRARAANRKRKALGMPADTSVRDTLHKTFPHLVSPKPKPRPASYKRPQIFENLLNEHPSYHVSERPSWAELITEAYFPGELSSILNVIAEQQAARRRVILIYNRKAIYIALDRRPREPS